MGKLKKFRSENHSLALLLNMDQTSTNEVPAEKRTIENGERNKSRPHVLLEKKTALL